MADLVLGVGMRNIALCCFVVLLLAKTLAGDVLFRDDFSGARLGSDWRSHCSEGARIKPTASGLEFHAPLHEYCHISRPLDRDMISVSTRITPSVPAGETWCTSVFLFWSDGNWLQMGLRDSGDGGGYYYSVDMTHGIINQSCMARCDLTQPHYVRIQVGEDCVRFYCSESGTKWTLLRTIVRPAEYSQAPSMLILGKGYGLGKPPYAEPLLANNHQNPGEMSISKIANLRIETTPDVELHLTKSERLALTGSGRDLVAEIVLAGTADPTYKQIASFFPPMQLPREAVSVPEHPMEISIDHLGRFECNFNEPPIAWMTIGKNARPFGDDTTSIKRRLYDGYLPILTLNTQHDDIMLEQTVFGWSESMSADNPLHAFVRVRLKPQGPVGGKMPDLVSLVTPDPRLRMDFGAINGEVYVRFPWPEPSKAQSISSAEFNSKLKESVQRWRQEIDKGARFDIPDKRLNEAYRAWIGYSRLLVDKIGEFYELHDGAGFYEVNYGYSVLMHCIALDEYGMHESAEKYLDSVLHLQQSDGLYTQNFGLADQGMLLTALARHYDVTRDKSWLQRVSKNIVSAGNWLIEQRKLAPTSGVTKGLINFRPYCDYTAAEFNYCGDACCCVGLEKASEALRSIGMTAEAELFTSEARRYRADILSSMDAAVFRRDGQNLLPLVPDTHRILKDSNYTGRDYYSLISGCLLDSGFLPAEDRRAYLITDLLEQNNGLLGGLCRWGADGVDHAYALGYLLTALQRGEPRTAIMGLYGFLAYGMTQDTYSGVECTTAVTGANYWTLPHLYSCTQQLRLLRNMLIREDGDTLRLGDAMPRQWLEDGKRFALKDVPTQFGNVSLTTHATSKTISMHLDPPTRSMPGLIKITLRHPSDAAIRSVAVDGRVWNDFTRDSIELRGISKPTNIIVNYR